MDIGYHPSEPDTIVLCPGEDTLYTSVVSGDSFLWNTGDTTQSVLLDSQGLYYATIGFGDCSSSDSVYLMYADGVEISGNTVCQSDTTFFVHVTPMPSTNISSYSWDFGDGSGSTLANPSHVYSYGDTFLVSLEIETNTGCIIDTFTEIVVHPNPIPEFSFENVCDGSAATFLDQGIEGSAGIISRSWDIDNNGTTDYALDSINHTYSTFATYAVEYKLVDALGCIDSLVKQVYIHPNPVADFDVSNECLNVSHQFADSSVVAQGSIENYSWSFGDGNTSTQQNPLHTYSTAGSKSVTLSIVTDSGCVDSKTWTTQVYHLPVADFSADSVCENVSAIFNDASTTQSGLLTQFSWTFGNGQNSNVMSPMHDYSSPGLYDVKHIVTSNFGCRDTVEKKIRIYPAPQTAFGWSNNVCQGDPLPFYDQSVIQQVTPGVDAITSWEWIVNDELFSTNPNPIYQTSEYQTFHVRLMTYSNYGCSTYVENVAQIFPLPKASFIQEAECQDYPSSFQSTSVIPLGLVDQWHWEFGDGSTSDVENPQYSYTDPGVFPISLHIISNKGCEDSTSGSIKIPETPNVDFSVDPNAGCTPLTVTLRNNSVLYTGDMTYNWFVNNQQVSSASNPTVTLVNDTLEPKYFDVRLQAKSELGCTRSAKLENVITVYSAPKAKFDFELEDFSMFSPSVAFKNKSEQSIRWKWNFGNDATSTDFSPSYYYENHGKYNVKLKSWNAYDCSDTITHLLVLDPVTMLYVPSAFTPNGDGDNDTWGVKGHNEGNVFHIKVWDRWGHLVFESDDMDFAWDGIMNNGKLAPIGVYAYHIVYRSSEKEPRELTGQFSVVYYKNRLTPS